MNKKLLVILADMSVLLLLPFILWLLTACVARPEPTVAVTSTQIIFPTPIISPSPTLLPTPTQWIPPTQRLVPTSRPTPEFPATFAARRLLPTKTPTASPTPFPAVAAPPGLLYADSEGQWLIATDGKPTLIITDTDALLSPNRQMAIVRSECCTCGCDRKDQLVNLINGNTQFLDSDFWYVEWSQDSQYFYYTAMGENGLDDIWVEDATTGEKRDLSKTPDRRESQLFIWPNQPDYLFFYSWPVEVIADGEGWHGYPTVMKTDGTEYQVISNDLGTGLIALSPDGRTIAFSDWEHAWYYRRGEKAQFFPWQDFGLNGLKNVRFYSPSWASDGQKIAWSMSGEDRTGHVDGVGIFDLQTGTARFVRDWDYIEWSPNRRWIIGERAVSKPENRYGIWVADVNAESAHLLTEVLNSINGTCLWEWSPDEQWLAFNCFSAADTMLNDGIWLAELETGKLLKTNLPDNAEIRGWVNPQP